MNRNRIVQHAIEVLLTEELGRETPPDLESRILAAADRRSVEPEPATPIELKGTRGIPRSSRRRRAAAFALSAALGAACAAACFSFFWPDRLEVGPVLTGVVRSGQVQWGGRMSTQHFVAKSVLRVRPASGDRARTDRRRATHIELHRLGTLRCEPATVLEVMEMEWKEFGGGVAAGALTVSVVIGAVRWSNGGDIVDAGEGEALVMRSEGNGVGASKLRSSGAVAELESAKRRIKELETELARRPEPEVSQPPAAPTAPATYEAVLARTGYDDALAQVKWKIVGESVKGFLDVHKKIVAMQDAGEDIPYELQAEEDRWEAQMFAELGKFLDDVPGSSVGAKAHHPGVGLNLLASALTAAGRPLSAEQRRSLSELTTRFVQSDNERRAGYGEDTFDLERLIGEAEMSGRFFAEARGMLTGDQEGELSFGALADRSRTDPLGSGFQWSHMDRPIEGSSRADLAGQAGRGLANALGLSKAQTEKLRPLVSSWAQSLPAEWLDVPMDGYDRRGSHSIRRMRAMTGPQLQLMRDMVTSLDLTPAQAATLRGLDRVLVPFLAR